jgi:hypothetical protein
MHGCPRGRVSLHKGVASSKVLLDQLQNMSTRVGLAGSIVHHRHRGKSNGVANELTLTNRVDTDGRNAREDIGVDSAAPNIVL